MCAAGRALTLHNGTPQLARVVATGCAAGALITALLAVEADPGVAAAAGVGLMAVAGEIAVTASHGPGSFAVALIDAIAALDGPSFARALELSSGSRADD